MAARGLPLSAQPALDHTETAPQVNYSNDLHMKLNPVYPCLALET